ncbi:MAG: Crp/Fnr family transcriptional regulator [Candidatus Dormibacteraeota bacterium]|nr:Crp/Fnr family transcriptional regulator [Candidatus Dormibacteraeota bacterium]
MASAPADPIRVLLSTYLFQDLSPAELEPLAGAVESREYKRGQYVFRAGDSADCLYVLAAGQIKYSMPTAEGDEWILEVLTAGAVFGEPGLFAPERNRVVDALATRPSRVLAIRRDRLIDFLERHRPAMMRMLEGLAAEVRRTDETVTDIGFAEIRRRIVRKLLELAAQHGHEREDGSLEIALSVPQTTLAGLVGATRENVNRALRALSAEGKVRLVGGRFLVPDLVGLRREADRGRTPLRGRNRIDGGTVVE